MRKVVILAGGVLALTACAEPQDSFVTGEGQTFAYVDESYDLFPNRQEQGEAWRRQALGRELAAAGLCASGYSVTDRVATEAENRFGGGLYRVTYQGHC